MKFMKSETEAMRPQHLGRQQARRGHRVGTERATSGARIGELVDR